MPRDPVTLEVSVFKTELGWIAMAGHGRTLARLTFGHASPQAALAALETADDVRIKSRDWNPALVKQLTRFAAGQKVDFARVTLDLDDETPFVRKVIERCRAIPYGERLTYGELAAAIGAPRAARAVGNAMRSNRTPLVVPCHRVVAAGARLGGYSGAAGVRTKLRLLEAESRTAPA
ncbi:MAG: methylated-DNA--[protein]-cysteine S-methyltransferase [Pirellulales bacterium]|nr:methylated-DNA--[protein]-cysteine S-methyltransferase [Pirellulales bacterium]